MPTSATANSSPATSAKNALVDRERGMASLRSFEPFVDAGERGNAMEGSAWYPHDQAGEPLVSDGIEPDSSHSHCRIIRIPRARREAHQRAQGAADQRCREQARCRDAVSGAAVARVEPRPPEQ